MEAGADRGARVGRAAWSAGRRSVDGVRTALGAGVAADSDVVRAGGRAGPVNVAAAAAVRVVIGGDVGGAVTAPDLKLQGTQPEVTRAI